MNISKRRQNKELSTEQRSAALAEIRQETEKAFQKVMGEAGIRNYRQWNRSWFENMNLPPAPRAP